MTDNDIDGDAHLKNTAPQGPYIGKERTGLGGGVFIAIFPIIGAIVGGLMGQPSIGLLAGLALGIITAIAIWLVDRNKGNA